MADDASGEDVGRLRSRIVDLERRLAESERTVHARAVDLGRALEEGRDLLESAPDAILITDASGRIVRLNAQAEAMFGYDRGELLGEPVEALLPERFRRDTRGTTRSSTPIPGRGRWARAWTCTAVAKGERVPRRHHPQPDEGGGRTGHRHHPRRHRPQAGRGGAAAGEGGGRGRQPGQERVPGQHEPRDPHADERHPRHDRAGPRHRPDRRAARVPRAWSRRRPTRC